MLGVLTILGADLLIFLAGWKPGVKVKTKKFTEPAVSSGSVSAPRLSLQSILLLLLGGFLALCSASSLLLAACSAWLKTIGEDFFPLLLGLVLY